MPLFSTKWSLWVAAEAIEVRFWETEHSELYNIEHMNINLPHAFVVKMQYITCIQLWLTAESNTTNGQVLCITKVKTCESEVMGVKNMGP